MTDTYHDIPQKQKADFAQFSPRKNLSVPNALSVIRLLLVPLIVYYYFLGNIYLAALIVIISFLTDIVDGYIARNYNQVTPLGKVLDPIADKVTQLAIAICLCSSFRALIPIVCILFVKECLTLYYGIKSMQYGMEPVSAFWWGKLSTGVFYIGAMIIMFFHTIITVIVVWIISIVLSITLIYSLIRYILYFRSYYPDRSCNE